MAPSTPQSRLKASDEKNPEVRDGRSARGALVRLCETVYLPSVSTFVLIVILVNAAVLGLETSPAIHKRFGFLLSLVDHICLAVFCVELIMKMICERFRFFLSSWNIFDFIIVGISVAPGAGHLSVLRSLRILRAMRLITKLPKLRVIVESIIHALPSIGWITVLLVIIFYIFAVLSTTLFGRSFPDFFGDIGESMFTLFQLLTLDSWSTDVSRPVMKEFPYAYLVFIPFILISSFIVLNVFIGVIVNSIHEVSDLNNLETERAGNKAESAAHPAESERRRGDRRQGDRRQGDRRRGDRRRGEETGKVPDHLRVLGNELGTLREQLSRIEEMLRAEKS
ncbi:MAG: ion transporter [Deltaproteobacteria bacterium]|jgi:voltage-gated sodium channel|nr:ion transporter [Deltaproteobacteria bacterium]